ncbi:MAG TPA: glycoside hydrolase family 2 [Bacteroidales bacterium]|nr:glycoside hydrolase family 2 [Bacteroidales bacterium]
MNLFFRLTGIAFVILLTDFNVYCESRSTINLNGTWDFDQTTDAFPPKKFTRKIQVPGLITLAEPKIEDYDKFFKRPDKVEAKEQHSLYNIDYTPRYSWYRKKLVVPSELKGQEAVITLKKSQYVTQIFINGIDLGTSMACYTPIEFRATNAIRFGEENEILIRVGDRTWLPSEAAGGTDKEKEHYLPGIWDDVLLSFTGDIRVNRLLILPSVTEKKATVKIQLRNFKPAQIFYGDRMSDSVLVEVDIKEKSSDAPVAYGRMEFMAKRDNLTEIEIDVFLNEFKTWSPEHPELYLAEVKTITNGNETDKIGKAFGMRDFIRNGKFFYLNGQQYYLRGTNITLQRFFEDPDSKNLVWDKNWVRKMLIDYPKQLQWNAMRICVGIVPDFWYDLADEYGLMFQNEWLYWQNHGWDEQIRKEYTDWVWSDGSHPSIAIWDAINENTDEFIGNILIPDLKKLDPSRMWDAGYMTSDQMNQDEMDEPHPYQSPWNQNIAEFEKNPYPLGNLDFKPDIIKQIESSSSAQLVNEYGWIWLWRNGTPSKLTVDVYNYYLGAGSTAEQNRELQAYWLQCETEWLRSNPNTAGVLAFCYLANNYGYTGDWFINDIADLEPGITLSWLKHCFAPSAVFLNLTDERYTKHIPPHKPGTRLLFDIAGINNNSNSSTGSLSIRLIDSDGKTVVSNESPIVLQPLSNKRILQSIDLPEKPGGYLLVAEYTTGPSAEPVISRRHIKIGQADSYKFFELKPKQLR